MCRRGPALALFALLQAWPAMAQDSARLPAPAAPGSTLLYFFSPDWRPPDLGKLAVSMELAMTAGGVPVVFQGFTRYEDFERQVAEMPPTLLIAPSWLETNPGSLSSGRWLVLARPQRHGKTSYRKALMTRPGLDSIDDLARGSLAATLWSMGPGSPATVLDAFHLAADSAKVVPVPKDVDALLALNFGQVDAALVTSEQYELMAHSNPDEAERLRVLAFSPEVKLPPLFLRADADPEIGRRVRELLPRLRELPEGATMLGLLGFDGYLVEGNGSGGVARAAATPHEAQQAPQAAAAGNTGSAGAESGAAGPGKTASAGAASGTSGSGKSGPRRTLPAAGSKKRR